MKRLMFILSIFISAFIIEVSFGAWAGWRGYNIVSSQNNDSLEAIAQIPLCAGRR